MSRVAVPGQRTCVLLVTDFELNILQQPPRCLQTWVQSAVQPLQRTGEQRAQLVRRRQLVQREPALALRRDSRRLQSRGHSSEGGHRDPGCPGFGPKCFKTIPKRPAHTSIRLEMSDASRPTYSTETCAPQPETASIQSHFAKHRTRDMAKRSGSGSKKFFHRHSGCDRFGPEHR